MIKVVIDSIMVSLMSTHRLVVLKAVENDKQLMFWISTCDADALTIKLGDQPPVRPLTHDFFAAFVRQTNLNVERVYIHSVINGIPQVQVLAARRNIGTRSRFAVACKLTDGLLTALNFGAPIYVSQPIMQQLSTTLDELLSQESSLSALKPQPAEAQPPTATT